MYNINNDFETISNNFQKIKSLTPIIEQVAKICIDAIKSGNKVMFCGNGGSAADSQHLAAELVGRYKINRPALNSIALTTDTSILTAVGNDFGYDTIFERQVEGLGKSGDVLIGLSTSGNSKNVFFGFVGAEFSFKQQLKNRLTRCISVNSHKILSVAWATQYYSCIYYIFNYY